MQTPEECHFSLQAKSSGFKGRKIGAQNLKFALPKLSGEDPRFGKWVYVTVDERSFKTGALTSPSPWNGSRGFVVVHLSLWAAPTPPTWTTCSWVADGTPTTPSIAWAGLRSEIPNLKETFIGRIDAVVTFTLFSKDKRFKRPVKFGKLWKPLKKSHHFKGQLFASLPDPSILHRALQLRFLTNRPKTFLGWLGMIHEIWVYQKMGLWVCGYLGWSWKGKHLPCDSICRKSTECSIPGSGWRPQLGRFLRNPQPTNARDLMVPFLRG